MIKYVSIDDIANNERYPFTKGQVRHFIANRNINGLSTSIRKIGRRVYIREDMFEEWIESFKVTITEKEIIKTACVPTSLADYPQIKLKELDFSIRTMNCLMSTDVKFLIDLSRKTESELLSIRNMGKRSINEIIEKLTEYGLLLKEE